MNDIEKASIEQIVGVLNIVVKAVGLSSANSFYLGVDNNRKLVLSGDKQMIGYIQSQKPLLDKLNTLIQGVPEMTLLELGKNKDMQLEVTVGILPESFLPDLDAIDNAGNQLLAATTKLFENSSITLHEDGRITGTGMGHHIARAMRKAVPGSELYDAIHNKGLPRPANIIINEVDWNLTFKPIATHTVH